MQLLYSGGFQVLWPAIMGRFIESGEIDEDGARHLLRLSMNPLALFLIEEIVLYGQSEPSEEGRRTADFFADTLAAAIDAGAHRARSGSRRRSR